jgi:addiction module HigA family antidote
LTEYKITKMNMTPAHPGDFVRYDVLEEFKLSVTDAAEILGVCPETLANLVDCKIGLSPDLALRLEKGFALNMDLLLRIQAWHDAVQMRARWDEVTVERYPPVEKLSKLREAELALLESPDLRTGS